MRAFERGYTVNLHDHLMDELSSDRPFRFSLWLPESIAVVIGYSQRPAREVHLDRCRKDGVPVLRRRGGGGAVVLMPGVLCYTIAFASRQSDSPYYFFQKINGFIADQLENSFGIFGILSAGISDLAIGDKKILGCSMHKSRHHYLYQGSLLVHPEIDLIEHLLRHPSKEPDYRRGRDHPSFVTSLRQLGYTLSADQIKNEMSKSCQRCLAERLL